jgi:hypothetical protein
MSYEGNVDRDAAPNHLMTGIHRAHSGMNGC